MAAPLPKKIGKYDVLDVVGKGGMGIVYRAKDPFLDRMVAIKIMTISYADYPDLLQRFYREAKATANLQHPNIVTVYELGEHEGSPYLAMQYLEGSSLESILRARQELTLLQKIDVVIQACHGLAYAHQRGIVHRDIKPGNIMVLKDGNVKIVDFGIARIGDTNFTRTGQFMGSLNYMSLEQLNDKLQVDQRTDVYSTGVVLYQILTGALPFEAESTGATLMKILNDPPPPFSKYISGYPPEIEIITMKALAKDRDQRYSSADELALDLTQLLDHLKHEQIDVHMQQAEHFLQQNELFHANDELMQVLRLDKQHTKAATMLRTLRKQIEKEQSAEQARRLRDQAQEAFEREDFDPALGYLDQAIHLDTTNVDLQQFRSKVQAAKAEIEHLRQIMQRAENAHRAGNLDTAKQAIEEVLARRPNDTRVKSLYRMIQKELEERMRQKRMETFLEAARKEMANRRYTAAFDLLKEAEKVDPEAPALRSLMESFTAARDQEQRRRALEQVTRQAEQALNTDDHQAALNLLAEGLQRFPSEPALLKLKELAETQKQAAQTKSYVRERISAAREILNAGNAAGALKVLQDAQKKVPGNLQLESLISLVQERLAQDRDDQAKSGCVQQANEAIARRAYGEAIQILEAGQVRFASSPEIDNLLRFAREQQAKQAKQQEIEKSVRRAHEFLRNQEYDQAIGLLESLLARIPDEELRIVLEEARQRRDDLNRQITGAIARGQQFLSEGSPGKALEFLQGQPTAFRRSDEFRELLLAAASQNQPVTPEPELPLEPVTDLEAPEPQGTMVWGSRAWPEIEQHTEIQRVPTGRLTVPEVRAATPPVRPQPGLPNMFRRLTRQQKLMAAGGLGFVLLLIVIISFWPSSNTGTVVVHSNVDGAEIIVDGTSRGLVDSSHQLKIDLREGDHKVEVRKEGFAAAAQPITIVKGREIALALDPTAPAILTGTLTVQTNEDGADVYVDDALSGTTSNKKLSLSIPARSHFVRVEKSGFDLTGGAQTVQIVSNQEARLKFTLTRSTTPGNEPPKPKQDAYLKVVGTEGALVRIDGVLQPGTISSTGLFAKVSPDAAHHVEATLNGYKPFSQDNVKAKAGERFVVRAYLEPLAQPKAKASIVLFSGSPESIPQGQSAKLSWETKDATAVELTNIGVVGPSGTKDVNPAQTTKYTLTAKGEGGNDSRDITVTVIPAPVAKPPAISSFGPSSTAIKQGESVTLTWSTSNASSVTINNVAVNPPSGGSWMDRPAATTSYTLIANGTGSPATKSVTVTVENAPPPPLQPLTPSNETAGIRAALDQLQDAYGSLSIDEMVKIWPTLDSKRKNGLKTTFKDVQALRVKYTQCSSPSVTGDVAKISCTYTQTNTSGGKVQPAKSFAANVTLKKTNGNWFITDQVFQ